MSFPGSAAMRSEGELSTQSFTLLVAVVLRAGTDAGVNKRRRLVALADTPEKMAALGEDRVAN